MNERTIFLMALKIADEKNRAAFLDSSCAQDLALRKRVEALIAAHQRGGSFLNIPAVEQMARQSLPPNKPTLMLVSVFSQPAATNKVVDKSANSGNRKGCGKPLSVFLSDIDFARRKCNSDR